MSKRIGKRTIILDNKPYIIGYGSVVGKKEFEGPLGHEFDAHDDDSRFGEDSYEKAESLLQKIAIETAMRKANVNENDIKMIFAGDLLNQCIGSYFGLRAKGIPLLGLYGACSTMTLGLSLASIMVDSGAADYAAAVTSSHFCSAERQYRFPLEYGAVRPQTAQWTVTGSGATILSGEKCDGKPYINAVCFGEITDLGVTDTNNMGAAMAPDDVKIRPYLKLEGMVFFYTQIQYLRGFRALLRIFKARKNVKNSGLESRYIYPKLSTKKEVIILLKYLVETFGYNRPFKISEVKYDKCARSRRYTLISELCKKGKLVRFEKGIYYIPKTTKFGVIPFDPMTVIEKKYIKVGDCAMGYFAGSHLLYMLGLSKTRANTIDIFTNNETKDSKIVFIGGKRVRLHTTRTTVDKWNASVLCFLELMNGVDVETLDEYKRKLISDYIIENRITQKQITKYIPYFPDKTCRNLIESEVIYRVPQ